MKGTIHKINYELWIFKIYQKTGKNLIPFRYPFLTENQEFIDGEEIEGKIVLVDGVEYIKRVSSNGTSS